MIVDSSAVRGLSEDDAKGRKEDRLAGRGQIDMETYEADLGRRLEDLHSQVHKGGLCQEDAQASCCTRDGGGPFGAALWEEASNRHELLRSKAAVVNVMVKRRGSDHVRYG